MERTEARVRSVKKMSFSFLAFFDTKLKLLVFCLAACKYHTMRILVLFAALIVTLVATQPTIKSDWAQVNVKPSSLENEGYFIFPRAAAFPDGRYIVVYTVLDTSDSVVVGQIFFANGSIAKEEFSLAGSNLSDTFVSAPNVVVFDDNTFLVVYRDDDALFIYGQRFGADANPIGDAFRVDDSSAALTTTRLQDGVELVGFADKSFAIIYYSGSASCSTLLYYDADNLLKGNDCIASSMDSVAASIVGDSSRRNAYLISETGDVYTSFGEVGIGGFINWRYETLPIVASNPVVALSGDQFKTFLFTNGNDLHYAVERVGFLINTDFLFPASAVRYSSPAVIGLNETSVLLGYIQTEEALSFVEYQTADLVPLGDITQLVPSQVKLTVSPVNALQFIPLRGELLVIGKRTSDGAIMRQILTFCGNGHIELNEECDGSAGCDAQCRCTNDLIGYKGVCGLPNIIPVLDCVQSVSNGRNLHFSFINEDGIVQVMEHGYQNMFTPTNLAADRPTTFNVGTTTTFPNSPYTAFVSSDVSSINWVLGSYNLTVDLTNITAVQCPASVGFVSDVSSVGYIFDGGFVMAENYVVRYNLSLDRLTYEAVQTEGSVPTNKRAIMINRFDITITVAPANDTNSDELTPTEAVKAVLVDFKNNSTEVAEDLLNGYDPESAVKEITPLPTGVEVRGTRYDSSNVTPPAPITAPQTVPTSVTPLAVSGAPIIVPSLIATIFLFAVVA